MPGLGFGACRSRVASHQSSAPSAVPTNTVSAMARRESREVIVVAKAWNAPRISRDQASTTEERHMSPATTNKLWFKTPADIVERRKKLGLRD